MNKTWLVLRYEVGKTLGRKSFLFLAFGLPVIAVLIFLGATLLRDRQAGSGTGGGDGETPELKVEGYVDAAGIIEAIPDTIPAGMLVAYLDEESAREAMRSGEIAAYYLIAADYVETGELVYVNPGYRLVGSRGQSWVMRQTIFANLLGNDPELVARAWPPMEVWVHELDPAAAASQVDMDNVSPMSVPYLTTLLFTATLIMSSSFLLESVGKEKENRLIEVLLSSITPRQMLTGKIVALGMSGLLQTAIWGFTGYALVRASGRTVELPAAQFPAALVAWAIVFFLVGYGVYASLMAALGALVPNIKEGSQATFLVIWPVLIPMMLTYYLAARPHGPLAVVLSLFPLTAPTAMMTRLAAGGVPIWQPLLAAGLMLLAAALIIRSAARLFRAQTLLSGQAFSAGRFYKALLGRAS